MNLVWSDAPPQSAEYVALRDRAGLGARTLEGARAALPNSLCAATARHGQALVAMGRVVGDGGCFVQLVDIAVDPAWQGRGLGREITGRLIGWCEANLPSTCHISLVARERAVPLYESFGFQPTRGLDRYADARLRLTR